MLLTTDSLPRNLHESKADSQCTHQETISQDFRPSSGYLNSQRTHETTLLSAPLRVENLSGVGSCACYGNPCDCPHRSRRLQWRQSEAASHIYWRFKRILRILRMEEQSWSRSMSPSRSRTPRSNPWTASCITSDTCACHQNVNSHAKNSGSSTMDETKIVTSVVWSRSCH